MRTSEGFDGRRLSRADFLRLTGVTATAVLLGTGELQSGRAYAAPSFAADPFSLGVASGDPGRHSLVLWTRLAPDPVAADGSGGMPPAPVTVRYEVARDDRFRRLVRRGTVEATDELAHSVHAEVGGLRPGFEYFYRFKAGSEISPVGRTRTTPAGYVRALRFALASCQRWQEGLYTVHQEIAARDLDLVVFVGDYIYENGFGATGGVRQIAYPAAVRAECATLGQYRCRYGVYKSDPHLQAAHAAHPWLITWDDHEVDDNYAALTPSVAQPAFPARRAAAYQAFYEHQPLGRASFPAGLDLPLYRSVPFGRLADFRLLDGRQYRSVQACGGDLSTACPESLDPARTMLGAPQEAWLLDGLSRSPATWNVLAQQVIMCRADRDPGPELRTSMDNWNGYSPARQRLFDGVAARGVENLVVLTGDAHCSVAANLRLQYDDPESPAIGSEIVGTSVSSGANGADMDARGEEFLTSNPHMLFYNARRGYVDCTVTRDAWRSDFRSTPDVSRPDVPLTTIASFVSEAGVPGLHADGAVPAT
jgi:alkaline phosphatase D